MSWRDKMSAEDLAYFKEKGLIRDLDEKPIGYNLIWRFGGKDHPIVHRTSSYAICVSSRNKKEKLIQFKSGKFIILPIFKK